MPSHGRRLLLVSMLLCCLGGGCQHRHLAPNAGHGDLRDAVFGRRHPDRHADYENDAVMELAREVTAIEDDLRRDGTITVKTPDVWGDGNLMHSLQEFDQILAERTTKFDETLQAYIARSDQMDLQAQASLAAALDEGTDTPAAPDVNLIDIENVESFGLISRAKAAAAPSKATIGLEPTELARQHATYVDVCQALRRRHMGDDNSRAAGYGLYKFRIPVSVLPGRETSEGYAAIANLRAQLEVDAAHLKYTFPKLMIADAVEEMAIYLLADWGKPEVSEKELKDAIKYRDALRNASAFKPDEHEDLSTHAAIAAMKCSVPPKFRKQLEEARKAFDQTKKKSNILWIEQALQAQYDLQQRTFTKAIPLTLPTPGPSNSPSKMSQHALTYGQSTVALRIAAQEILGKEKPTLHDLREWLFGYLGYVHNVVEQKDLYRLHEATLNSAVNYFGRGEYDSLKHCREAWFESWQFCDIKDPAEQQERWRIGKVSWLLGLRAGMLNYNLTKIVEELRLKGKVSNEDYLLAKSGVASLFIAPTPEDPRDQAVHLWQTIIREAFPLHVFTLDPQVEEQNAYDAFSRRRELQLALAYGVAKGRINTQGRVALSRQLALDEATIALNRTVVGFSHGDDTFGWYFYPRIQTPPTESTNIGALARMIWSTGPTERYDQKHRNLEPGVRECEVLVAMPSFVTKVSFDVTTNWEKLTRPGVTKRSYEEMLAQGGRVHQLKMCLGEARNQHCYRPGDYQRMISRVEQLEQMLGMQTHLVNIPYEYEQSGKGLFDRGDRELRPRITGHYGLEYLEAGTGADAKAYFFLTGKNFHPTLTHVIVGGYEAHSIAEKDAIAGKDASAAVEVINRELIRVEVGNLNAKLSDGKFQVRVGTPAGLSNMLSIAPAAPAPAATGFSFKATPTLDGYWCNQGQAGHRFQIRIPTNPKYQQLTIVNGTERPFPVGLQGNLIARLTAKKKDGSAIEFGPGKLPHLDTTAPVKMDAKGKISLANNNPKTLLGEIEAVLNLNPPRLGEEPFELTVEAYVAFDRWPAEKLLNKLTIEVAAGECKW